MSSRCVGTWEVTLAAHRGRPISGAVPLAIPLRRTPQDVVKVTVNLPEQMVAQLKELAASEGESFTQALKEAIAMKLYIEDALGEGAKLLLELPDKSLREIVFRY